MGEHLFRAADVLMQVPRLAGRALIRLYQLTLSPFVGLTCRHLPTCSAYGDEALARFGLWAGGWMTLARLLRCHPLGTRGLDFVPDRLPAGARWYLPWRYGRWRGTNTAPADGAVFHQHADGTTVRPRGDGVGGDAISRAQR